MQITRLDHVNVLTTNLAAMVAWYENVLGLKSGKRPDFAFPGAWIYVGDQAVVHLVESTKDRASVEPRIEHYAFGATGLAELIARLKAGDISHTIDPVPGFPTVQVNLADCDGNHIHVDFDVAEYDALG